MVSFVGVIAVDADSPLAAGEGIQYTISDNVYEVLDTRQFGLVVYPSSAVDRKEITNRLRADEILTSEGLWRV